MKGGKMGLWLALWRDQKAATAAEYGLIAAGVALAIVGTLFALGGSLETMFFAMSTAMSDAAAQMDL